MHAEAERDMLAGARPVDDQIVWIGDRVVVPIARDEPHRHLVALLDRLATELEIRKCGAPQVQHRCVPADDFRYQTRHQLGVLPQLLMLLWELREAPDPGPTSSCV